MSIRFLFVLNLIFVLSLTGCSGGGRVQLISPGNTNKPLERTTPEEIARNVNLGRSTLEEGLQEIRGQFYQATIDKDPLALVKDFDTQINETPNIRQVAQAVARINRGNFFNNLANVLDITIFKKESSVPKKAESMTLFESDSLNKTSSNYHRDAFLIDALLEKRKDQPTLILNNFSARRYFLDKIKTARRQLAFQYLIHLSVKPKETELIQNENQLTSALVEQIETIGFQESDFSLETTLLATNIISEYGAIHEFLSPANSEILESDPIEVEFVGETFRHLKFATHCADFRRIRPSIEKQTLGKGLLFEKTINDPIDMMGGNARGMLFYYFENSTESTLSPTSKMAKSLLENIEIVSNEMLGSGLYKAVVYKKWQEMVDRTINAFDRLPLLGVLWEKPYRDNPKTQVKRWFELSDLKYYWIIRPYRKVLRRAFSDNFLRFDLEKTLSEPNNESLKSEFWKIAPHAVTEEDWGRVEKNAVNVFDTVTFSHAHWDLPEKTWETIRAYEVDLAAVVQQRNLIELFLKLRGMPQDYLDGPLAHYPGVVIPALERALSIRKKIVSDDSEEHVLNNFSDFDRILDEIRAVKTEGHIRVNFENADLELGPGVYESTDNGVVLSVAGIGFHPLAMIKAHGQLVEIVSQGRIEDPWIDVSSPDAFQKKHRQELLPQMLLDPVFLGSKHERRPRICRLVKDILDEPPLQGSSFVLIYEYDEAFMKLIENDGGSKANEIFWNKEHEFVSFDFLQKLGSKAPLRDSTWMRQNLLGHGSFNSLWWKKCFPLDVLENSDRHGKAGTQPLQPPTPTGIREAGAIILDKDHSTYLGFPLLVSVGGAGQDGFSGFNSPYCEGSEYQSPMRAKIENYEGLNAESLDNQGEFSSETALGSVLSEQPDSRFDIPSGSGGDGEPGTEGGTVTLNASLSSVHVTALLSGGKSGIGGAPGSCGNNRIGVLFLDKFKVPEKGKSPINGKLGHFIYQ